MLLRAHEFPPPHHHANGEGCSCKDREHAQGSPPVATERPERTRTHPLDRPCEGQPRTNGPIEIAGQLHRHHAACSRELQHQQDECHRLARVAKLAGAPQSAAAGLYLHTPIGTRVERGQPLFTLHAETPGELAYALAYLYGQPPVVAIANGQ